MSTKIHSRLFINLLFKWRKKETVGKKERFKEKSNKIKTASSPEQDLHPDWDRFRGTMLYPLSCGELAMNGEKILRLYVTSSTTLQGTREQRFFARSVLTLK